MNKDEILAKIEEIRKLSDLDFVKKCKELESNFSNKDLTDEEGDYVINQLDLYMAAATESQLIAKAIKDCVEIFNFNQDMPLNTISEYIKQLWDQHTASRELFGLHSENENFIEFDFEKIAVEVKEKARREFFENKYGENKINYAYRA